MAARNHYYDTVSYTDLRLRFGGWAAEKVIEIEKETMKRPILFGSGHSSLLLITATEYAYYGKTNKNIDHILVRKPGTISRATKSPVSFSLNEKNALVRLYPNKATFDDSIFIYVDDLSCSGETYLHSIKTTLEYFSGLQEEYLKKNIAVIMVSNFRVRGREFYPGRRYVFGTQLETEDQY